MLYSDHLIEYACFSVQRSNPKYMNSKMIYKFKGNMCNDVYIGETKGHFLLCEYENLRKSILTEKNFKNTLKDTSVIRKHCHNHGHAADISRF